MKTLLSGLALTLLSITSMAQEPRTLFENPLVIATATGTAVQLSWKKGAEDISYFIVERSTNGVDFTQCALVFTSEDPAFVDYRFRDKMAANSHGLVYRLAIVTQQKRISYLPAKTVIAPENMNLAK